MEAVEIRRQIYEKARDMVFFSPDLVVSASWSTRSSLNINMAEKKRGDREASREEPGALIVPRCEHEGHGAARIVALTIAVARRHAEPVPARW